jgi:hypothetical protein
MNQNSKVKDYQKLLRIYKFKTVKYDNFIYDILSQNIYSDFVIFQNTPKFEFKFILKFKFYKIITYK